jgi:hypothetical protein
MRDEVTGHVSLVPLRSEDTLLQGRKGAGVKAHSPEAARGMEEIQMRAGLQAAWLPGQDVAGFEERQVKGLAVEGDEAVELLQERGEARQEGTLFPRVAHEELLNVKALLLPVGNPNEKGVGTAPARKAVRFSINEKGTPEVEVTQALVLGENGEGATAALPEVAQGDTRVGMIGAVGMEGNVATGDFFPAYYLRERDGRCCGGGTTRLAGIGRARADLAQTAA